MLEVSFLVLRGNFFGLRADFLVLRGDFFVLEVGFLVLRVYFLVLRGDLPLFEEVSETAGRFLKRRVGF
ncbi:MAG: hypothetical protein WCL14_13965 [Bacteroidota bacterium]